MGQRPERTPRHRRYINGKKEHEKNVPRRMSYGNNIGLRTLSYFLLKKNVERIIK